jgi:uncharacterized protein YabN with tetrapyrrole methylase and pyrophosphatase domain
VPGYLTVVGTGYMVAGQVTPQAQGCIERADKLFYLVPEPATCLWLESLNPSAESLHGAYQDGRDRMESYHEMVERILGPVRRGLGVCAAFYGHPGVCVFPGHEAVRRARGEGYEACMLPGVSSADCLFAELGIDPGTDGCQMYEASSFLYRKRRFDPTSPLLLWQVGAVGVGVYLPTPLWGPEGLRILTEVLLRDYPGEHEVVIYEASQIPICPSRILRIPLRDLAGADVTLATTLYVPRLQAFEYDWELVERLVPTQSESARREDA